MCQYQDSGLEEERQQQRGISQWGLSENTKVDGNRHPPYVTKKQAEYGHHLVFMPKIEAHGQVGQLKPGTPGVGQYTAEHEQKAEIFRAQYPERYTGGQTQRCTLLYQA